MIRKSMILLLLPLCFIPPLLKAESEKQIALEVYPQWFSTDDYTIQGNIGVQKVYQTIDWLKYYVKPSISYQLDQQWGLHGGLGLYYREFRSSDNNFEFRPFQGISHYVDIADIFRLTYVYRDGDNVESNYLYFGIENIPSLIYWLNR